MPDDSWKGEHFLRIPPKSHREKQAQAAEITNAFVHMRRRKKGIPAPAAKRHWQFMRSVGYNSWKLDPSAKD